MNKGMILALTLIFSFSVQEAARSQATFYPPENNISQGKSIWKTLSKITFRKEYDEIMGFKVDVPVFSEEVLNLEGKVIEVKGYIIPVEGYKSHKEFVFSAYPYNMCFFCGGAGPETVMEVAAKSPIEFSAEQITIRGILHLNSGDINRLIYALTEVEMVK